jgi:negative regulator of flagellin synthesis FlgM
MSINGVGSSKVIDLYSKVNKNVSNNTKVNSQSDSLEISSLGKSLSAYSLGDNFNVSNDKLDELKNQIHKGTYNVNSKLIAQKLYDNIKGKGV